ncbi:DUF3761 domain-containing protein [Streptomyces sp. NPDC102487]|uniref:DUF3761 domain-containing protein n=1 Tax=Streptomyces sp. NPDC102487 TaxID=3366182 RepID=UPI0037FC6230
MRPAHHRRLQASSAHPRGATAKCKDNSYSYGAHFRGTCSHHRGVKYWYREADSAPRRRRRPAPWSARPVGQPTYRSDLLGCTASASPTSSS